MNPNGADDGFGNSGTFSTGLPVPVPPTKGLLVQSAAGFTATLKGTFANGKTGMARAFVVAGQAMFFSGDVYNLVTPSGADANISWEIISDGPYAPFFSIPTTAVNAPTIVGVDNRIGVTEADAVAITLATAAAGTPLYAIRWRINATAYTSGTPTYGFSWVENGHTFVQTVTSAAANAQSANRNIIQPDAGTLITIQVTTVFSATVNVAAELERLQ